MKSALFVLLLAGLPGEVQSGPSGDGLLTIDALVDIKHPSRAAWSPDGARIAFLWERGGVQNLWVVDAAEGAPRALTSFDTGSIDGLFWSADGSYVWRIAGDKAQKVPVKIIQRNPDRVLVDAKLDDNEVVATEGLQRLRDGADVKVLGAEGRPRQPAAAEGT